MRVDISPQLRAWRELGDYLFGRQPEEPASPKLALRPAEAAEAVGLSRAEVFRAIARGDLVSFKVGRARLIAVDDLRAFIDRAREVA